MTISLVREFLSACQLDQTLAIFDPETNTVGCDLFFQLSKLHWPSTSVPSKNGELDDRNLLAKKLEVDGNQSAYPLLVDIVKSNMNHNRKVADEAINESVSSVNSSTKVSFEFRIGRSFKIFLFLKNKARRVDGQQISMETAR
jgi:hypothetical protein